MQQLPKHQRFIVIDATDNTQSYFDPRKRKRTLLEIGLKLLGGILDYILAVAIFFSLAFSLQDTEISGCKVTRIYYQLMTAVPLIGVVGSFLLAQYDPQPRMVLEKAFYFRLLYWPGLTSDDRGWTALKRSLPSVFITISLIAFTVLIALDEHTSPSCIAKTTRYTFILAQWRVITTGLYSLSTLLNMIAMFFV